jgi:hypothetical protein
LLAAGVILGGCSASPHPSASAAPISRAEFTVLTNSGSTAGTDARLNNAEEVMTARCMHAKGLIYYPELETVATASVQSLPEIPPYRSLADRRANGYGAYAVAAQEAQSGHGTASPPNVPEQIYVAKLSGTTAANYWAAWVGPKSSRISVDLPGGGSVDAPTGGCRGAAVRKLYGSVANWIQATNGVQLITIDLDSHVNADPHYLSVVHGWARCMGGKGYHYDKPWDAPNWFAAQYAEHGPTKALRRREVAVAVADYRCAQSVSLVRVTDAVQHTQAEHLGRTLIGDLARIVDIDERALRVARRLVRGA